MDSLVFPKTVFIASTEKEKESPQLHKLQNLDYMDKIQSSSF